MYSVNFSSKDWMGSVPFEDSKCVLVGIPYDGTCCYRPGSRFAPAQIRLASYGIEEDSVFNGKTLSDAKFYDAGELELPFGNRYKILEIIKKATAETLSFNKKFFGIGGEHLVTLPVVEAYKEKYPDLAIIHFDAHTDLRDTYEGEKLSHATVVRRIAELVGFENLAQIGIRSGTHNEFNLMKKHNTLVKSVEELKEKIKNFKDKPVFVSLDLDVLDPSVMSGTGTPEPGGLTFNELIDYIIVLKDLNVVGLDVVELAPDYDKSGVSTITAAKIIRELLLTFC